MRRNLLFSALSAALFCLANSAAHAEKTAIAVAANFTEAAKEIALAFKQKTGHDAVLSFGASGQFYTQIAQSAPFDVFLSADEQRPKDAIANGYAVADSLFTYAVGTLVLWSKSPDGVTGEETLKGNSFTKLAIANPASAPYGGAAIEAMKALKVYQSIQPKIVQGTSIAQAFQFIETGNADLGFIALSQLYTVKEGSRWIVPQALYQPIRQDAVLLKTASDNKAARAFLAFLREEEAKAIIKKFGYGT